MTGSARCIDFVIFRSHDAFDVAEGAFALAELRRLWPDTARLLVGVNAEQALKLLPDEPLARGLMLDSVWLTLEERCTDRLHAALDAGFDAALACDSTEPAPMPAASYATLRGMERFVDSHPASFVSVSATCTGRVELTTVEGLRRRLAGSARVARVVGAWAHDASGYFSSARAEVLPLVPAEAVHVLDVGGGRGEFLAGLKAARPQAETHLVELTANAAGHADAKRGVDHVWVGDFLSYESAQRFGCITFLDVLEHLETPDAALRHARGLLSADGVVVASIPNVGHWSVVADLLEGRWDWAPAGIHCVTHLRFFTQHTITRMFGRCGFVIEAWQRTVIPCTSDWLAAWTVPHLALDRDGLDTYAYILRARPVEQG